MDRENGPIEELAKLRSALYAAGWRSDLGIAISLHGGPADEELLRATAARDYDSVRRVLVGAPYDLDPRVAEMIIGELRTGRAEAGGSQD